jgi:hypothetical protein
MALSVSRRTTKLTVPERLIVKTPAASCVDTSGLTCCTLIDTAVTSIAGGFGAAERKPDEFTVGEFAAPV